MHIYIKNLRTAGHFLLHTLLRQLEEHFKRKGSTILKQNIQFHKNTKIEMAH